MLLLTFRDLMFRSKRVVVVIAGTTLVFTLLLLMSGLTEQFAREPRLTIQGFGGHTWILRAGATGPFSSAVPLRPNLTSQIEGVRRSDPVIMARHVLDPRAGPTDIIIVGFAGRESFGAPHPIAGRVPRRSGQIVLDETAGVALGAEVPIGSSTFRVVGLAKERTLFAGMPLAFVPLADALKLVGGEEPVVNAIIVDRPPTAVPPGLVALSVDEIADDSRRPIEQASASINLVRVLLWVVSALIIGGVVLLSAMERRRDFAVMKATGASTRWLLTGLALQGVVIALMSAALAAGVQYFLAPAFPLQVHVTPLALLQLPLVAVVVALAASVGGLRQVASTDPAAAFAGPGA